MVTFMEDSVSKDSILGAREMLWQFPPLHRKPAGVQARLENRGSFISSYNMFGRTVRRRKVVRPKYINCVNSCCILGCCKLPASRGRRLSPRQAS